MNDTARYFDSLANRWGDCPEEYGVRDRIVNLSGLREGSTIADIGCGKGIMVEHLLKTNPVKITGIDISGEMIRYAKARFTDEGTEFINGDIYSLDLPVFDALVIFNSYPHFLDKKALCHKLSSLLPPGGILIIAHSRSRDKINGGHRGKTVSPISVPLEKAEAEAAKFCEYFEAETLIDDDKMYFIKLIRKSNP